MEIPDHVIAPPPVKTACAAQERGAVHVSDDVATEPSMVLVLVKYATPGTAIVEVVEIWKPGACLLLNVVQSALARHPACEPEAVWQPSEPPEPICVNDPVSGEEAESVEVETQSRRAGFPFVLPA